MSIFAAGCKGTKNKVVPVEGKITFKDGSNLPEGTMLVFNPTEGRVGGASAKVKGDGSFKAEHVNGSTGAEIGKYRIVLRAPEGDNGDFYKLMAREYYGDGFLDIDVTEGMAPVDLKVVKLKQ